MVVEAMVMHFCCFRILRELHTDQVHDFESCLMQEVFQCFGGARHASQPGAHSWMAWPFSSAEHGMLVPGGGHCSDSQVPQ
jgi:hypothetical protein